MLFLKENLISCTVKEVHDTYYLNCKETKYVKTSTAEDCF